MSALLKAPHGIALRDGSTAEYFIADTNNRRIRVVRGGTISTLLDNVPNGLLSSVFGVTYHAGSVYATTWGSGQVSWCVAWAGNP